MELPNTDKTCIFILSEIDSIAFFYSLRNHTFLMNEDCFAIYLRSNTLIKTFHNGELYETDNKRNCYFRIAWSAYVCLQNVDGSCTKHSSAWRIYDCFYRRLTKKSTLPNLYLRFVKRYFFRFQYMVDSIFICLDDSLGYYYAST